MDGDREPEKTSLEGADSKALLDILRGSSTQEFFEQVWQQRPQIFRYSHEIAIDTAGDGSDGTWNDDQIQEFPLKEVIKQRWHVLRNLLQQVERSRVAHRFRDDTEPPPEHETPLIFHERELLSQDESQAMYGDSLFAPYLNGCSVVLNHGDLVSPWIAALCQDLQKTFPHAYANCYLTPPNSQAVPPHADDRDVLVIQLVGSKDWRVYQNVPVPFPYPHEQVGKQGLPVPTEILEGPTALLTTMRPGDVLYMPRGFVHEASCSRQLSFHVTVALATHDWTLAGMMSMATEAILTRTLDYRKSILPTLTDDSMNALQSKIDSAIKMIQDEVTAENVMTGLKKRLEQHNHRAFPIRMKLIHEQRFPPDNQVAIDSPPTIGPQAAHSVSFDSIVRAATPEERATVTGMPGQARGLHVREEIADSILSIVSRLKSDPSMKCTVSEFRTLLPAENPLVCDLALLSLAKQAVSLGAFAIVNKS